MSSDRSITLRRREKAPSGLRELNACACGGGRRKSARLAGLGWAGLQGVHLVEADSPLVILAWGGGAKSPPFEDPTAR